MTTPCSPWIGSIRTATVVSSIAAASAAASPYGTIAEARACTGRSPRRASGSVEKDTIVVVRPWKLPSATMIVARPSGTPLTS